MWYSALTNQQFGQYKLKSLIGTGGMSAVFSAQHISLGHDVAVKVLDPRLALDPTYIHRFNDEARFLASLRHPNIVRVIDHGVKDQFAFIVMDYLRGGSLAERLKHEGRIEPLEFMRVLREIASALDYTHGKKIVHGDLKPQNILFDEHNVAYLTDFGISGLVSTTTTSLGSTTSLVQSVAGTFAYMAPERWRGKPLTPWVDQYAMAITAHYALSGTLPFNAPSTENWMYLHLQEAPPPVDINQLGKQRSESLTKVLNRALAKDPQKRYPSMLAFAGDFEQALHRSGDTIPWRTIVVGASTFAAVALGALLLSNNTGTSQESPSTLVVSDTPPALIVLANTESPTLGPTETPVSSATPSPSPTASDTAAPPTVTHGQATSVTPAQSALVVIAPSETLTVTTALPTATNTLTPSLTATLVPTTPSQTASATATPVPPTHTPTTSPTPSATLTATASSTPSATLTASSTPSASATQTSSPSPSASLTQTRTATLPPTLTPALRPIPDACDTADIDRDGDIDRVDYDRLVVIYITPSVGSEEAAYEEILDLNTNGRMDIGDLFLLRRLVEERCN